MTDPIERKTKVSFGVGAGIAPASDDSPGSDLECPLHGQGEALRINGLQQVVDAAQLEGAHCEVIERGGEDDGGARVLDRQRHLDSVHLRHADVQEGDVGGELPDELDGARSLIALRDHLDIVSLLEPGDELRASEVLVVDHQGPEEAESLLEPLEGLGNPDRGAKAAVRAGRRFQGGRGAEQGAESLAEVLERGAAEVRARLRLCGRVIAHHQT